MSIIQHQPQPPVRNPLRMATTMGPGQPMQTDVSGLFNPDMQALEAMLRSRWQEQTDALAEPAVSPLAARESAPQPANYATPHGVASGPEQSRAIRQRLKPRLVNLIPSHQNMTGGYGPATSVNQSTVAGGWVDADEEEAQPQGKVMMAPMGPAEAALGPRLRNWDDPNNMQSITRGQGR